MKCFTCKEEISDKFRYALSQNVCPFCGRGIFSAVDYHFRKSLAAILRNNGVNEVGVVAITNDIENLLKAPDDTVVSNGGGGVSVAAAEVTATVSSSEMPSETITVDDINRDDDGAPPTSEEEAEVQAMIASGELVMTNVMSNAGAAKKRTMVGKPVPKPISRL